MQLQQKVDTKVAGAVLVSICALLVWFAISQGGLSGQHVQLSQKGLIWCAVGGLIGAVLSSILLWSKKTAKHSEAKVEDQQVQNDSTQGAAKVFALLLMAGLSMMGSYLVLYSVIANGKGAEVSVQLPVEYVTVKKSTGRGNSPMTCLYTAHYRYQGQWLNACTDKASYEQHQKGVRFQIPLTLYEHPWGIGVRQNSGALIAQP